MPFDLGFDLHLLLWPLLVGTGVYLLITVQPFGRPKPDLGDWLRRYDIDARLRAEMSHPARAPLFDSALLEAMVRPVLDDIAALLYRAGQRVGFTDPARLERKLAQLEPDLGVLDWYARKVGAGLIGFAVGPATTLAGSHLLPFWTWPLTFLAGFVGLDVWLEERWRARQTRLVLELDAILELIGIAAASGLGIEQAIREVVEASSGELTRELRLVCGSVAIAGKSIEDAFEALAERTDLPELWRLAGALGSAAEQGLPLGEALAAQAEASRDAKRARLVAEGGKAVTRMIVPVIPAILLVLLVIIGAPASQVLLGLDR